MSHPSDARVDIVHPLVQGYLATLHVETDPLVQAMEAHAQDTGFPLIGRDAGRALERLRPGGLVCVDNVLWGGKIAGGAEDPSTEALRAFNDAVCADSRVEPLFLSIGDGLLVARVR